MPTKYDLATIGSGGGTFAATIRASALGKSVVMIERGTLGGTCVSTGYVPSKALIVAAGARRIAVDAATRFPGIAMMAGPVDMSALVTRKQALVESLRDEKYADAVDSYGWQVLRGDASFVDTPDAPVLDAAGSDRSVEAIEAHHYLVATGSHPRAPPINGLEEIGYLTSTTTVELAEVPGSLLVLSGSYVILEQAQLFARLGSQVTLPMRSRLASKEEPEVSKALQEVFADEGVRIVSRAMPIRVSRSTGGEAVVTTTLSGGSQGFRADQVLIVLGRRPVTDSLSLDAVGVNIRNSGEVVVSDRLQSSSPRVRATGDVIGHPEFVYVAAHHGTFVAENAFANADRSIDYAHLPRMTFTGLAIGTVGITEKGVLTAGIRCDCRVLPLHHVPRALVNRDTREFVKIVANAETREIFGLTAVARDAGELAAADIRVLSRTVVEVANAWAPYLTMAEGIRIAVKASTTDPSLLSCCA